MNCSLKPLLLVPVLLQGFATIASGAEEGQAGHRLGRGKCQSFFLLRQQVIGVFSIWEVEEGFIDWRFTNNPQPHAFLLGW